MPTKPDCYSCKWRAEIPGDAHSACHHPRLKSLGEFHGPLSCLIREIVSAASDLSITADQTGMRKGWFNWPINFDPVWLRSCSGFEPKTPNQTKNDEHTNDNGRRLEESRADEGQD